MKTTNLIRAFVFVTCIGLIFACNKNNAKNPGSSSNSSQDIQTQADDQAQVSDEDEALTNDVNTVLYSQNSIAGNSASAESGTTTVLGTEQVNVANGPITGLICDATVVVDLDSDPRT